MNAQRYTNVLKIKLELHITVDICAVFVQDGAPYHPAEIHSVSKVNEN